MSAQFNTFGRLDAAELNQLNTLLNACADAHSLEELDGFICGFVSGPHLPPREQWLALAIGQSDAPEGEDGRLLRHLVERHWDAVIAGFREDWTGVSAEEGPDAMYYPLLDEPKESGYPLAEGWARGFRAALNLMQDAHWDALEQDEECVTLLNLIHAFDTGEKSSGVALTPAERDQYISPMVASLQYLHRFWWRWLRVINAIPAPRRVETEPGRNDSCPCGSGNKYKKCCGSPGKLH